MRRPSPNAAEVSAAFEDRSDPTRRYFEGAPRYFLRRWRTMPEKSVASPPAAQNAS